ncbi:MAG TPA: allophanate hydrolase [Polyangia bacterium]|nr:allophanate hydrolase [Polyangia bacterium]
MSTSSSPSSLDLTTLRRRYDAGETSPAEVVADVLARIERQKDEAAWISMAPRPTLDAAVAELERRRARGETLPLYGVPFGVKDNIDVAGLPTTAACPAYSYTPREHAPVVARLVAAGAIPVGKTNMDQFATGLVGVRSPYGVPRNAFDARWIPGGSSSGSGAVVASGVVSFALGTDTAGSGRVPAAFNNLVGLKPSRGLLSTRGVVPACRSRDCVSVFGLTVDDVVRVAEVARAFDDGDPYSRVEADGVSFRGAAPPARFRFGVPRDEQVMFDASSPAEAEAARGLFARAHARLVELGGEPVAVDFAPFEETAALLYGSAFVAERLEATQELLARDPEALIPVLRTILKEATTHEARGVFEARARLTACRRRARAALAKIDVMLVPTAPPPFTVEAVLADPLRLNTALGRYVNFVNLLDLAALAVPAGFTDAGKPFGVTLVGGWGSDALLAGLGDRLHRAGGERLGATSAPLSSTDVVGVSTPPIPDGWPRLAVVGAHLTGEPLNHQLTSVGGRLVRACRTSAAYKLFALPNTQPPKPGMVRVVDGAGGVAIEVEVWALPPDAFGEFVARVASPLCIGSVELDDGARVSGFLCEPHGLANAREISSFGGWRAYRRSFN